MAPCRRRQAAPCTAVRTAGPACTRCGRGCLLPGAAAPAALRPHAHQLWLWRRLHGRTCGRRRGPGRGRGGGVASCLGRCCPEFTHRRVRPQRLAAPLLCRPAAKQQVVAESRAKPWPWRLARCGWQSPAARCAACALRGTRTLSQANLNSSDVQGAAHRPPCHDWPAFPPPSAARGCGSGAKASPSACASGNGDLSDLTPAT